MKLHRTRIKFCGIRSKEAAQAAVIAGADALGLVFYEPSPRFVTPEIAAEIAQVPHPFVSMVGLFVNASSAEIDDVLAKVPLQILQFHGDESPEFCDSFSMPYIKAIRVGAKRAEDYALEDYAQAQGFLFDTYKSGQPGGTGEVFDWTLLPTTNRPIILAGGLSAHNVADAITQTKPYAVDTSGGIESAPGVKDPVKMRAFVEQVKAVDSAPQ